MSDNEQDEIVSEFLVEAHENLDSLDRELLVLEKNPHAPQVLASVFRRMHTVKGACGFLGFSRLEAVAHASENLLSKIRDEEVELTPGIITALLGVADTMRGILAGIEAHGKEGDEDFSAIVASINRLQRPGLQAVETFDPVPDPPSPPAHTRVTATMPVALAPPVTAATADGRLPGQTAAVEPTLDQRAHNIADAYLRVDVALLDKLMNLVGELVLARNQVLQVAPRVGDQSFFATSQRLNLITTELQSGVMKTRMQPIGSIWDRMPRVVRDLSLICGKQVRVDMKGSETELDKTIIEAIKDPLTHLVRNCVDHGIESAATRVAAGKPPDGRLSLRAYHEGGQVNIEISDDGKGMDLDALKNKALERNLITPEQAARMTERDLQNLIFLPGFSTAEKVSTVSGRGVGMDVVKTNIEKIGGVVDLNSRRGLGTTFRIKIPLTLAIIPALMVTSGGDRYAVPQISLLELVRLKGTDATDRIESIHGTPVYRLRGDLLPLVYLNRALEIDEAPRPADARESVNIVVLQADAQRFGLVVDQVNDTEEIVVKPLGQHLKGITAFAGATIMGDGRVALILDILGIAQRAGVIPAAHSRFAGPSAPINAGKVMRKRTLLLFLTRDGRRMAIPLSIVARLEEFPRHSLERLGDHYVVQYRGRVLPLVDVVDLVSGDVVGLAGFEGGGDDRPTDDPVSVIVYSEGERSLGVVVGEIIDIFDTFDSVDTCATVQEMAARPGDTSVDVGASASGLFGCAVIQQKVTELIDLQALVRSGAAALLNLHQGSDIQAAEVA